jgi:hypothetical protein
MQLALQARARPTDPSLFSLSWPCLLLWHFYHKLANYTNFRIGLIPGNAPHIPGWNRQILSVQRHHRRLRISQARPSGGLLMQAGTYAGKTSAGTKLTARKLLSTALPADPSINPSEYFRSYSQLRYQFNLDFKQACYDDHLPVVRQLCFTRRLTCLTVGKPLNSVYPKG